MLKIKNTHNVSCFIDNTKCKCHNHSVSIGSSGI